MLILGINAFHADSAACLVRDGKLVAAVEEERFRRIKHWAGFPSQSIRWCLEAAGAKLRDLDYVAVNQDTRANMRRRLAYLATSPPRFELLFERLKARRRRAGIDQALSELFPDDPFLGRVATVEHHLAHLSSAFHLSPFEEANALSLDGFGDFASTVSGVGRGTEISIRQRVLFPHSLGIFYQAMTQYLGFCRYGDEYKVMGLAPYGEPRYAQKLRSLIELRPDGRFRLGTQFFRHETEPFAQQWQGGPPTFGELYSPALVDLLGPPRDPDAALEQHHFDIARSTQALYEEVFFHVIAAAKASSGLTDLVLAGGCANNSVANGKVRRRTAIRRLHVHPAPGDAGGAIGAAFVVWHRHAHAPRFRLEHAFWGPEFHDDRYLAAVQARASELHDQNCTTALIAQDDDLFRRAGAAVAGGKVVGWFQGRMEWGPRALGNRSILCDPRRPDMKDILNRKIKRRESFRPFAPAILRHHVAEWFEEDDDVPFMSQVFQIRPEKRSAIPAVTHVDGSGRLQTVSHDANPRFASLIDAFHRITGTPLVLNTSFNENEPIVCTPEEALDCFLRTEMDVLVLGNRYIERHG